MRTDPKDSHDGLPGTNILKCFSCNSIGHRAIEYRVKPEGRRTLESSNFGDVIVGIPDVVVVVFEDASCLTARCSRETNIFSNHKLQH